MGLSRGKKCSDCGFLFSPGSNSAKRCWSCRMKEKRRYQKEWYHANLDKNRKYCVKKGEKLKDLILEVYGKRCACCGEKDKRFLTIDHINGGGAIQRREIKRNAGKSFYRWLKVNNFPKGYQILCYNCNQAKHIYGKCPHKS